MDTLEEYTEICRKADEIQTRKPTSESLRDCLFCTSLDDDHVIWLPNQNQLQVLCDHVAVREFHDFWNAESNRDYRDNFHTQEQLWLAYLMAERYGKRWDGEKWVPVNDVPLGAYPLISKIMAAKDRFLSDNHIPRYLHLNEKTWRNLLKEITPSIVDTKQCGWAEYVSVYGLQVRIDSDVPDNEIMVYGRYK